MFGITIALLLVLSESGLAFNPPQSGPLCQQLTVPVTISTMTQNIDITPPRNQSELTGLITRLTSLSSNVTKDAFKGTTSLTANYSIWSLLCFPSNVEEKAVTTVEFAVHGINFDHSYWNFGESGSEYNYVNAATRAGHAIFIYDRLGVGRSTKPDGIKEVQTATQIEVAAQLIIYLKSGNAGHNFIKYIGIGHSYGSLQLAGLASQFGNLLDATILTGFSPFQGGVDTSLAAFGLTIASNQNNAKFGSLSNSYLTTQSIYNDQAVFFAFPFFDFKILQLASATKGTATLGEFLTQSASIALNYTNPVLIVTGDKDFIFCGGDCFQPFPSAPSMNVVEASRFLFPSARKFDTMIPANTGHAINVHRGAANVYSMIQSWVASNT